jgi:hypothetical protein
MSRAYCSCLPILLALAAVAVPAGARAPLPAHFYTASGSCLNSPEGFNSKLEPVNSGVAWTTTFNAVGGVDADGNVAEVGQSVDTASFGVGPRMHAPAANAYKGEFTSTVTANSDGSYTVVVGKLSGRFTDGPYAGQTFTATQGSCSSSGRAKTKSSYRLLPGHLLFSCSRCRMGSAFSGFAQ